MKNISLILIFLCLVSCSKSTKSPKPATSPLIGTWIRESVTDTITSNGSSYMDSGPISPTEYYQFNTDGSGVGGFYQSTVEEKFTYNMVNSKLYFTNVTSLTGVNVYSYSPPETYLVQQLNDSLLVIFSKDTVVDSSHSSIDSHSYICKKVR